MLSFAAAAIACAALASPVFAIDFEENDRCQIEFVMPSGNIGCIYTPKGGTGTYEPMDGGPELSCDRVEPAYVRVKFGPSGFPGKFTEVGDASCCGSDNVFGYGEVWSEGPFICWSFTWGLKCRRDNYGFSMSRNLITLD